MMMELIGSIFVFAVQLFLMIDPIAGMPVFLSLTRTKTKSERKEIFGKAVLTAIIVLLVFAAFNHYLITYFSISLDAIRIGGGILLFVIGFELIYGRKTRSEFDEKDYSSASKKNNLAVTPLGIPLLAGPGSIITILLFSAKFESNNIAIAAMFAVIILVLVASYIVLINAERIMSRTGELGTTILMRFMGLMVIFMSVQYVITGIQSAFF